MSNNIVFFGPPGAGKGTQASRLTNFLSVPHISTGDMFRYHIKNDTELGKKVKEYSLKGELAPDSITIDMVKERLSRSDVDDGFLLDGFPRSVPQAEALDEILEESGKTLDYVLNLAVDDGEIKARLLKRAEIEGREDDADVNIIENRINTYKNQSEPCLGYYSSRGIVKNIDGVGSIDEIFETIKRIFV